MANIQLTQELVKSIFDYKDGFLYWKVWKSSHTKIGSKAGGYHKGINRNTLMINNKTYLSSRIIFLWHHGYLPSDVDHENRITIDDRIENLRAATTSENCKNKTSAKGSSSRYLGVYWHKQSKKWRSSIRTNNMIIGLGNHRTQELAALAYNKAAVMYHGEFANLNIILPSD